MTSPPIKLHHPSSTQQAPTRVVHLSGLVIQPALGLLSLLIEDLPAHSKAMCQAQNACRMVFGLENA